MHKYQQVLATQESATHSTNKSVEIASAKTIAQVLGRFILDWYDVA